jgi:hypothetical protein
MVLLAGVKAFYLHWNLNQFILVELNADINIYSIRQCRFVAYVAMYVSHACIPSCFHPINPHPFTNQKTPSHIHNQSVHSIIATKTHLPYSPLSFPTVSQYHNHNPLNLAHPAAAFVFFSTSRPSLPFS